MGYEYIGIMQRFLNINLYLKDLQSENERQNTSIHQSTTQMATSRG